jgi:hypothetical protein
MLAKDIDLSTLTEIHYKVTYADFSTDSGHVDILRARLDEKNNVIYIVVNAGTIPVYDQEVSSNMNWLYFSNGITDYYADGAGFMWRRRP